MNNVITVFHRTQQVVKLQATHLTFTRGANRSLSDLVLRPGPPEENLNERQLPEKRVLAEETQLHALALHLGVTEQT